MSEERSGSLRASFRPVDTAAGGARVVSLEQQGISREEVQARWAVRDNQAYRYASEQDAGFLPEPKQEAPAGDSLTDAVLQQASDLLRPARVRARMERLERERQIDQRHPGTAKPKRQTREEWRAWFKRRAEKAENLESMRAGIVNGDYTGEKAEVALAVIDEIVESRLGFSPYDQPELEDEYEPVEPETVEPYAGYYAAAPSADDLEADELLYDDGEDGEPE